MIGDSLLISLPIIKRFVRRVGLLFGQFSDPMQRPLDGWPMSETYGQLLPSEARRPALFGTKERSAVLKITRLIEKDRKTHGKLD